MNRNGLALTTALLGLLYGVVESAPTLVDVTGQIPTAFGWTTGQTVINLLMATRVLGFLLVPVAALALGYLADGPLEERYPAVLGALAIGGGVGGAVGAAGVAATVGVAPLLLVAFALKVGASAAVGFAVAGFAGAAFAHVRTRGDERVTPG